MKHTRIVVDPRIMVGKPVIKGTRVTVEQVLRHLGAGMSIDQILDAHPHLTPDDIYAAASYAADVVANEDVFLGEQDNALSGR